MSSPSAPRRPGNGNPKGNSPGLALSHPFGVRAALDCSQVDIGRGTIGGVTDAVSFRHIAGVHDGGKRRREADDIKKLRVASFLWTTFRCVLMCLKCENDAGGPMTELSPFPFIGLRGN